MALAMPAAAPAVAAERVLSLNEAVALALENNDGIAVEREALVAAEAGIEGARGAYDPGLAAAAEWRQSTLPVVSSFSGAPPGRLAPTTERVAASVAIVQLLPSGGTVGVRGTSDRVDSDGLFDLLSPSYGTALGLELRQPLLRDRAIDAARFGVRVAAADRGRAVAELQREVSDTVAAVESAYWTLIAARREVEVRGEAVRLAEEQMTQTDDRIAAGMAPETEAAQPRAEAERRRGELLAASEAAARAENALKLLVLGDAAGAPWGDRLVPADDGAPVPVPVDVAAAMERALAARPELAAFAAVVDRRRAESALAADALRPALDAVVSYDRFGLAGSVVSGTGAPGTGEVPARLRGGWDDAVDGLRDGDLDDTRVALVLSVPLGNRRARAGAVVARSGERQAEAELLRARKQVRTEVLDAVAALDTTGQRIEAARAGHAAAEVQLAAERERFAAGMSTNFLVLTRQNDLSRARLEEIAAHTAYRQAATELLRATGDLLAERGVVVAPLATAVDSLTEE